jgi:fatty acid desaturase
VEPDGSWYRPQISRQELKALAVRTDSAGLLNFGLWSVLLGTSGYVAFLLWGSWWGLPAFFIYGTIYSSSDARWHECAHGTAFRTQWINELWYHLSSFMTLREGYLWRWSHSRHHTYTGVHGLDSEVQVPRPANLWAITSDLLDISDGAVQLKTIALHALGIVSDRVKDFVPLGERNKMIWSSRIYVTVILGAVGWSVAIHSILPLMFVVLPRFYGGWHHLLCSLTQHAALAENERDHRLNTRTVDMNPVSRFLYMNMNFHVEHHIFPMVPFHALPKLHEKVKAQLAPAYPGFIAVYRELIPALIKQSRDAEYYVRRPLPTLKEPA